MKKITFILGSMARGGAERVISILSNYYAEKGYQTEIIVLLKNEVGYKLNETTKLIDFTGNKESRLKRLPYWIKSIRGYVKENKPDVIVSFVARINLIVLHACKKLKSRVIVSERNDPKLDGRSIFVKLLTKKMYRRAEKVVFQTVRSKSYFKRLTNGVIIPNPISVPVMATERKDGKIVAVGRLAAQKNQKMLISAFKKLSEKHDEAYLEIFGDGELKQSLMEQAERLGLSEKVTLMGNVLDVHERIKDASMFCLSSDYEGLSNALLEAMAIGIPCVSTNCAGADEYIEDGVNGFLVDVGDENTFAEKMIALYENKDMQEQFSQKSKQTSVEFSLGAVMNKWDEIIEEAANE